MKKAAQDILKDLNPEQKKAVTHKTGPLLIVAGAGTGKTTVITRRLAHLVMSEKAKPDEILALTFTNKAAEEMSERVDKLLPYGYLDLWVSTFHAFAQRILEDHGMDIGISSNVELIDGTGAWLLARQNLDKFDLDYYRPRNNPTKFIKAMLAHFSRLKDEEITPEAYLEYAEGLRLSQDNAESAGSRHSEPGSVPADEVKNLVKKAGASSMGSFTSRIRSVQDDGFARIRSVQDDGSAESHRIIEIANAYHAYQELLHENNKMDFGDIINYCLKLFRERPNILARYQKQFKYILVDEFQDTNWAQYDLVKMLGRPRDNITVVADDDQSIYRFRGASMSNVIQFSKDYKDVAAVSLVNNYRSGQEILDSAYDFIQLNNPNRLEHSAVASSLSGISKKLAAQTKTKAHVEHINAQTESDEARVVAETILELKKKDKDSTWNDFAILVRANSQADIFEEILYLAEIPHQNYSAVGLYKTSLAMNIMSFFKVLDDYHESRAMFRLLNLPFLKIPAEDIVKMNHHAYRKRVSLYDAVQAPQKTGVSNEASLTEIDRLRAWIAAYAEKAKQEKPSRLLLGWLNQGYMRYLKNLPDGEGQEQFRLLKSFYEHIRSIESIVPDARVIDIVRILQQEIDSGDAGSLPMDLEAGPEMVKVMTIHSAKGLEFKYVFITNMVDRRFPTTERKEAIAIPDDLVKEVVPEDNTHIEEERRLFYVAMTRAKQGLFFTSAQNYGGAQKKKLSRFLAELAEAHPLFQPSDEVLGADAQNLVPQIAAEQTKKFYTPIPKRFSFTQLKIFDECPFAYKMQFILKVPLPGKFVFSYGTTMHSTLQQFMQLVSGKQRSEQASLFGGGDVLQPPYPAAPAGRSPLKGEGVLNSPSSPRRGLGGGVVDVGVSLNELLSLYENNWIDDWYDSRTDMEKYYKKGKESLKKFYESLSAGNAPNIKSLERGFNLKIGEYTIAGKMDRVDSISSVMTREGASDRGNLVSIVDYKTGSPPKNGKLTLADKRQLLIYQIAAEEVFGEKVEKLTYYYIDAAEPIDFIGTDKEKDEVKQWILKTIEQIKTSKFLPDSKQHFCDYCEYFLDLG